MHLVKLILCLAILAVSIASLYILVKGSVNCKTSPTAAQLNRLAQSSTIKTKVQQACQGSCQGCMADNFNNPLLPCSAENKPPYCASSYSDCKKLTDPQGKMCTDINGSPIDCCQDCCKNLLGPQGLCVGKTGDDLRNCMYTCQVA